MNGIGKTGQIIGSALAVVLMFCASSAMAETISSPSYKINGNLGGNFGGQTSSTSYSMTSIGGEAVVGNGSSGSYIIDQQNSSSAVQTMQLGVQPSGLVAYYPMDENTGTATTDASQYQHDGTLNGVAGWYAGGKLGSAVDMNGATDSTGTGAVLVPDNANLPAGAAMTVEAWVRQTAWYPNQAIASHWNYAPVTGGDGSWAFQTGTNNNLRVFISAGAGDVGDNYVDTAANTWNSFNAWRHVVMVYDGSQSQANKVKVYIDGSLVSSTAYGTLPSSLQNAGGDFSIGSFPGLGRALTGAVDQVKLFNRALISDEITAEYGAQNAGSPTGLTLGTITSSSTTSLVDTIVRTNATSYNLAVQQDHDLQSGANTIPSISGSIGSPLTWSEGVTKGLGFTLTGAPTLDSKWNSGAKYAAVPSASTTFYDGTGHVNGTVDVINLRLRLDTTGSQTQGVYTNTITYTGTMIP